LPAYFVPAFSCPGFTMPIVPLMPIAICMLDGIILTDLADPVWLLAGIASGTMMFAGQKVVRRY